MRLLAYVASHPGSYRSWAGTEGLGRPRRQSPARVDLGWTPAHGNGQHLLLFSPKLKSPFYTLTQATRSNGVIEIRNARVSRLSDLYLSQLLFTAYLSVSIPSSFCC